MNRYLQKKKQLLAKIHNIKPKKDRGKRKRDQNSGYPPSRIIASHLRIEFKSASKLIAALSSLSSVALSEIQDKLGEEEK